MSMQPVSRPGLGVFWMVVTGAMFVGVTALVKVLGPRIPAPEAAFLRYAFGTLFFLPAIPAILRAPITGRLWGLFVTRGVLHSVGVILWFFAMARIPIADVTAMNYLSPVYVTLGAALLFGERLKLRRILAVVAALVGTLIILRPGFRELGAGHIAMIFTPILLGGSYLLAKRVSDVLSPTVVVGMMSVTVTLGLAPVALADWVTPTLSELAILIGVACFATAGHFTMTLAFRAAPLAVTQPVTFLQLVWAVALGAVFFGEGVDPFVVLGGLVIVGAISFISWREMVLNRRAVTPSAYSTKT